jgi:hypothetical protein
VVDLGLVKGVMSPAVLTWPHNQKMSHPVRWFVVYAALAVAICIAIAVSGPPSGARWKAHFVPGSLSVVNSSAVTFSFVATNVGSAPGNPACTVDLRSPNGKYAGEESLVSVIGIGAGGTLPGHSTTFSTTQDALFISGNGARYVTLAASTVSCSTSPSNAVPAASDQEYVSNPSY